MCAKAGIKWQHLYNTKIIRSTTFSFLFENVCIVNMKHVKVIQGKSQKSFNNRFCCLANDCSLRRKILFSA